MDDVAVSPVLAAVSAARPARSRRTQAERSTTMRAKIQETVVECLAELGYAETSMSEVARRAGVSRGALQHHYHSKGLMIAHALETLTAELVDRANSQVTRSKVGPDRAAEVVDGIWRAALRPPMPVIVELRIAARTDEELRAILEPLERGAREHQRSLIRAALGAERADAMPTFTDRVDGIIATVRGLVAQTVYQSWSAPESEGAWQAALEDFRQGLIRDATE